MISADELRAAGALDVPEAWRHSLQVERDLFSGFLDDEETESSDEGEDDMVDEGPRRNAFTTRAAG